MPHNNESKQFNSSGAFSTRVNFTTDISKIDNCPSG